MFKGGLRPYEVENGREKLVPLVEALSADGIRGETPLSGMADMFCKSLEKNQSAQLPKNFRFLATADGVPSASITWLEKGGASFTRITDDLREGKKLADARKLSFSMPAFLWMQGETDQMTFMSADDYKTRLRKLINDINDEAKTATGQSRDVLCFGYQITSHLTYYKANPTWYATIGTAQLDLALDPESRYIMVTPIYMLTCSDVVHLDGASSRLFGEYVGYVMSKVLGEGKEWKPIHPVKASVKTKGKDYVVALDFYVPVPPLAFDTKQVSDPGNYGFSLRKADGTLLPIIDVKLAGPTRVEISTSENPSDARVLYGMTLDKESPAGPPPAEGARGNLRDSQGKTVKTTWNKKEYPLHNWTPFFDYAINEISPALVAPPAKE